MTLIAIATLGVLALGRIPVSLMPDVDVPRIVVQMSAQGSSAREIEQSMVAPMRRQLSQVAGLKDIESSSRTDAGIITLTFSPGSDMSLLFIEVNEKIDRAMGFMPKGMERPKVMKIGALDIPAFYVDVTGGKPEQTSRLVSNVISKRLEQLPQVAMVDYSGLTGTQITLLPDAARATAAGITNADLEKAISDNNIVLETLSVRDGIYRYNIHFDSQILSVRDIENIYISRNGRLLQLKDICKVEETAAERKGIVESDGKNAITMAVIKQSDAQMSDLQQSVDTLMAQLTSDYPELHFAVTRDQTQLLSYSMNNLGWNLVLGIIMASMVLFMFIGGRRLPLLVAISIPLSLILTLLCFYLLDISLNIISLSGLILGVGMIVDNAIIVIDNILQKDSCNEHNVRQAVREVAMPMLSSVLTTCSVFVPLIFLSGTAGALFYDQAMGISIALFCSLAVATLVIPVYHFNLCRQCRPSTLTEMYVKDGENAIVVSKNKGDLAEKMNYLIKNNIEIGESARKSYLENYSRKAMGINLGNTLKTNNTLTTSVEQEDKLAITVLTPTYNRSDTLSILYNSLCRQTVKDFCWLIVDDGSTDNTDETVNEFIKKADFRIDYVKKENGGKHTALNTGIQRISTPLTFIVDSDDYLLFVAITILYLMLCSTALPMIQGICLGSVSQSLKGTAFSLANLFINIFGVIPSTYAYGYLNNKYKEKNNRFAMNCMMKYLIGGAVLALITIIVRCRQNRKIMYASEFNMK